MLFLIQDSHLENEALGEPDSKEIKSNRLK